MFKNRIFKGPLRNCPQKGGSLCGKLGANFLGGPETLRNISPKFGLSCNFFPQTAFFELPQPDYMPIQYLQHNKLLFYFYSETLVSVTYRDVTSSVKTKAEKSKGNT